MTSMVEIVARAICSAKGCQRAQCGHSAGPCIKVDLTNDACRASVNELVLGDNWSAASAVLSALREPSEEMVRTGLETPVVTRGQAEFVRNIWDAMLSAAIHPTPGEER